MGKRKTYCTPDLPGTGPEGETCGTCRYLVRRRNSEGRGNTHPKCGKMQHRWTHGAATDIRVRWPACSHWDTLLPDWWQDKNHGDSAEAFEVAADWWLDRGEDAKADLMRRCAVKLRERDARLQEQARQIVRKFDAKHLESRP
jgi:hypothetical protein